MKANLLITLLTNTFLLMLTAKANAGIIFNDPSAHGKLPKGSIVVIDPGGADNNSNSDNFQARQNFNHTQTFRVGQNIAVDKIIIEIEDAVAARQIELKLFNVANTNAEPLALGTLVQSAKYTFASDNAFISSPDKELWLNWDLDPNVTLTAANPAGYALQMVDSGATGVGVNSDIEWTGYRNNPYAGGGMYRNINNALTGNFAGQTGLADGTLILVPIPEPHSLLLWAFGGAMIVGLSRRRARPVSCVSRMR